MGSLDWEKAKRRDRDREARRAEWDEQASAPRVITRKWPGHCRRCGRHMAAGDPALWSPGGMVTHVDCAASFLDEVPDGR